jgi:hypothetical protein
VRQRRRRAEQVPELEPDWPRLGESSVSRGGELRAAQPRHARST